HHRPERPGPRDAAVPLRRHEGIRPRPRARPRRTRSLPGNEIRQHQVAGLIDGSYESYRTYRTYKTYRTLPERRFIFPAKLAAPKKGCPFPRSDMMRTAVVFLLFAGSAGAQEFN